ncbi:hypothetical protein DFH06DRAFT_1319013 [Mycena polygramma]|nr:hypothetical protein DFH06DRAFT_1319013 [Mycena polygramma]
MKCSPFDSQELVDYCIAFLCDSPRDLMSCALVSCSWVHPAQARLFWDIRFILGLTLSDIRWERLNRTLLISPHLTRHIRRLRVNIVMLKAHHAMVLEICNFAFTHLTHASIFYGRALSMPQTLQLQQLLSLRTIRDVTLIGFREDGPQAYFKILERCSPAVRTLRLQIYQPVQVTAAPIIPTSGTGYDIDHQLLLALCPSTFSKLNALWLSARSIRWGQVVTAMNAIKILRIDTQDTHVGLDLFAFRQLSLLWLDSVSLIDASTQIDPLLSTIRAAHHVRTIRLAVHKVSVDDLDGVCDRLDEALSSTQASAVEIELPTTEPPDQVAGYFQRLGATNKLRIVPHNPDWWEVGP